MGFIKNYDRSRSTSFKIESYCPILNCIQSQMGKTLRQIKVLNELMARGL